MSNPPEKPAKIGFGADDNFDDESRSSGLPHDYHLDHQNNESNHDDGLMGDDDDLLDGNDGDEEPTFGKAKREKKKSSMGLVVGVLATFFLVVVGGGGYIVYQKKATAREQAQETQSVLPAQPSIVALPATLPVPLPVAIIDSPLPSTLAASQANVASPNLPVDIIPLQNSNRSVLKLEASDAAATAASIAANAAENATMRRDLNAIQDAVKGISLQIAAIKKDLKENQTPISQGSQKQVIQTVTQPQKEPSKPPVKRVVVSAKSVQLTSKTDAVVARAAPAMRDFPTEETIIPATGSSRCVTAIVNNLAYVTRRSKDGTETEQTVVVGDRIDGNSVISIDSRTKQVLLDGGLRITTSCTR